MVVREEKIKNCKRKQKCLVEKACHYVRPIKFMEKFNSLENYSNISYKFC